MWLEKIVSPWTGCNVLSNIDYAILWKLIMLKNSKYFAFINGKKKMYLSVTKNILGYPSSELKFTKRRLWTLSMLRSPLDLFQTPQLLDSQNPK